MSSSRRYFISIAPVEHINGKMAPTYVKCPNTDDPGQIVNPGFWYGYKRQSNPNVSRYGVRIRGRDLIAHPVTAAEEESRTLFTSSLFAVFDHKEVPADWNMMLQEFNQQRRYVTPIGFAVAACRANHGEWPARWIAS